MICKTSKPGDKAKPSPKKEDAKKKNPFTKK
jgi:hypothetical protein